MSSAESIVVSLEWGRKLRDAGWPQGECNFHWMTDTKVLLKGICKRHKEVSAAAPTAEEILRRLPRTIEDGSIIYTLHCCGHTEEDAGWDVYYYSYGTTPSLIDISSTDSLANAAAAMYCYLAENNLLPST